MEHAAPPYHGDVRVLLALLLVLAPAARARTRAVSPWIPRPSRILVVTAHPDDELLFAPFLAPRCVRGEVSCSIVVLTRGEGGGDPEVRTGEMARAAALLNLRLTQWSLPDIMTPWPERDALVLELGDLIAAETPDMILTFDPDHGTTGHPAHREAASLVLDTGAPNVYLLETTAQFVGDGFVLSHSAGASWAYFAGADWEYAIADASIHASQFSAAQVESLRTLPLAQRFVWLREARWRPTGARGSPAAAQSRASSPESTSPTPAATRSARGW